MMRAGPIELAVLERALERADHYRMQLDQRLARLIVTEYAAATKRGQRRK